MYMLYRPSLLLKSTCTKSADLLPSCLPAIRPTSGERIGPVFLTIQNIDTLSQICCSIKIYALCHGDAFHLSLLLFLFHWWTKWWEIAEEVSMNCMAYTYYVMLMAKCTCTNDCIIRYNYYHFYLLTFSHTIDFISYLILYVPFVTFYVL